MKSLKRMTVMEISREFGVHPNTVRNWVKGGLKHEKERDIGSISKIVIDPRDVYEFFGKTPKGD